VAGAVKTGSTSMPTNREVEAVVDKFNRWFVRPMDRLQRLPNDDGAFITLMTSLVLYERLVKTAAIRARKKASLAAIIEQLVNDFDVTEDQAEVFWNMIRDGFLHQGMPLQGGRGGRQYPKWIISSGLDEPMEFLKRAGKPVVAINPWKFRDAVVDLFRMNPHLLDGSPSFPWAMSLKDVTLDA
jgi:hypothetical protein